MAVTASQNNLAGLPRRLVQDGIISEENLLEAAFPGDGELALLSSEPFGSPLIGAVGREIALAPGEEAEIAFKSMMEIRNKLVEAYQEIMRMGT